MKLGNKGFSLAETIIAAGLLGLIAAGTMQLQKNLGTSRSIVTLKFDEIEIINSMKMHLRDKDSCAQTVQSANSKGEIPSIESKNGSAYYKGTAYGINKNLEISSISFNESSSIKRSRRIMITFKRIKGSQKGKSSVAYPIPVFVKYNSDNTINSCHTELDEENQNIVKQSCDSLGGVIDSSTGECELDYVEMNNGKTTLKLKKLCIGSGSGECLETFADQTCSAGTAMVGITTVGTIICKNINCPVGEYFKGIDSSGQVICSNIVRLINYYGSYGSCDSSSSPSCNSGDTQLGTDSASCSKTITTITKTTVNTVGGGCGTHSAGKIGNTNCGPATHTVTKKTTKTVSRTKWRKYCQKVERL